MKHTKLIAMVTLLLLGTAAAAAQSLGDYAREVRKNKTEPSSASRHYDNDNLPTGQPLSVVGPPPADNAAAGQSEKTAADPAAASAERQKAADERKTKIDQQKAKIDELKHELDLDQREIRLRTAAMYTDPSIRVRNSVQWDKDDAKYKDDVEAKQKTIEAAQQQLDEMQEEARKAGIAANEKDNGTEQEKEKEKDKDQNNDQNKDK